MKINTLLIIILLILIIISLFNDFKNIEGVPECVLYDERAYEDWERNNERETKRLEREQEENSKKQNKKNDDNTGGTRANS